MCQEESRTFEELEYDLSDNDISMHDLEAELDKFGILLGESDSRIEVDIASEKLLKSIERAAELKGKESAMRHGEWVSTGEHESVCEQLAESRLERDEAIAELSKVRCEMEDLRAISVSVFHTLRQSANIVFNGERAANR
jgi:hypothetical protein